MKLLKLFVFLLIIFQFFCETREQPNFKWLAGIALSTSAAGIRNTNASSPNAPVSANPAPAELTQDFAITVSDSVMSPIDFLFNTTVSPLIFISVLDPIGNPALGALVIIGDNNNESFFRATVDQNGNVSGRFTVNATTNEVYLIVTYNGQTIKTKLDIKFSSQFTRVINFEVLSTPIPIVDSDSDGVADEEDFYPNDPSRASKINYPSTGYYTVAYEDLFPKLGDADFNDYVVRVRYEEDLNATGNVVRIRGYYQHVAKGAGYDHLLKLNIPDIGNVDYTLKNLTSDGIIEKEISFSNVEAKGIELFPSSKLTIPKSNTALNSSFQIGKKSEIEVILKAPVSKTILSSVPYDLFLYVMNTKKEIHFAGKYFDAAGEDIYLDVNGFPWAVMIPGDWKWPYEKFNIHAAYPTFENWYKSKGSLNADWYNFPNLSQVFSIN
jgi:LruC domain-containing protein